ncbi:IS3 family transposase, partial [Shuttleworthella satelles]|uniref:IS3 family transposase n=1 Tax=Shuttleworthella satelles TaxID=177972 RepID=UPI0028D03958
ALTFLQAADNIEDLKEKMLDMQMEIDILKETINVLKKDPGVDQTVLRNREKAVITGALKNKYSLQKLCFKLEIPRSSYYYHKAALRADDKYRELRSRIIKVFQDNRCVYGYRKIHQLLRRKGTIVSEKIVRRIVKEESLVVKICRRRKYNSY